MVEHPDNLRRRHLRSLAIVLALVLSFVFVEVLAGILTGSLALTVDAGHMATDAVGVSVALVAGWMAVRRPAGGAATYGLYRLEVLAALGNALLLALVGGFVIVQASRRIVGGVPEILSGPMLVVALVGLAVNVVSLVILRRSAATSLNVEGAYVEVLGDLVASIGVVAAAVLVALTGWAVIDAAVAVLIGAFILPRALRLGGRAVRVLAERAPQHIDVVDVRTDLLAVPGVVGVHDVHVWTVSSGMEAASAHLVVADETQLHPVLDRARALLDERFDIAHATLQVEPDTHEGCDAAGW